MLLLAAAATRAEQPVFDRKHPSDPNDIIYGGRGVQDHTVVAALCSAILPGVGQAINKNPSKKIVTHAVVGLLFWVGVAHPIGFVFGLFHVWSAWDALIDRPGGYINGCVLGPERGAWLEAGCGGAPDEPTAAAVSS